MVDLACVRVWKVLNVIELLAKAKRPPPGPQACAYLHFAFYGCGRTIRAETVSLCIVL